MGLAGDVLWLVVSGFAFAAITVILCWPISAMLSRHIVAPTVKAAPETGASAVGITLASVYNANRIAPPIAPLTTVEKVDERMSNDASITLMAAPMEPNGTKLPSLELNADRLPAVTDRANPMPVLRTPQRNQSAAVPPQFHQLSSPRAGPPHQRAQPAGHP
jgi:hypothetical protein